MNSKEHSAETPKGHFKYESMLRAMPPDIVKELARRRLEELAKCQAEKKKKAKV